MSTVHYTIKLCTPGGTTVTHTQNREQAVSIIATHLLDAAPKGISDKPRYVEALGKFAVRQCDEHHQDYVSLGINAGHRWAWIDTLSTPKN